MVILLYGYVVKVLVDGSQEPAARIAARFWLSVISDK